MFFFTFERVGHDGTQLENTTIIDVMPIENSYFPSGVSQNSCKNIKILKKIYTNSYFFSVKLSHKIFFLSGIPLLLNQAIAMLFKKVFYDLRNPIPIIIQNIMPIITVILSITDYRKWSVEKEPTSLNISFASYGHTVTLIEGLKEFDLESLESGIINSYKNLAHNSTANQEVVQIEHDFQKYILNMVSENNLLRLLALLLCLTFFYLVPFNNSIF